MKRSSTPTRKAFNSLAAAVAVTAATFGLTTASAHIEGPCFYIAYRTPNGYLARTPAANNSKAALYAFEKALFDNILNNH
jgi:hypothetical protein